MQPFSKSDRNAVGRKSSDGAPSGTRQHREQGNHAHVQQVLGSTCEADAFLPATTGCPLTSDSRQNGKGRARVKGPSPAIACHEAHEAEPVQLFACGISPQVEKGSSSSLSWRHASFSGSTGAPPTAARS